MKTEDCLNFTSNQSALICSKNHHSLSPNELKQSQQISGMLCFPFRRNSQIIWTIILRTATMACIVHKICATSIRNYFLFDMTNDYIISKGK
jgi:hypothetical protein